MTKKISVHGKRPTKVFRGAKMTVINPSHQAFTAKVFGVMLVGRRKMILLEVLR